MITFSHAIQITNKGDPQTGTPLDPTLSICPFFQATDASFEYQEGDHWHHGRHHPHRRLQLVSLRLGQVRPTRDCRMPVPDCRYGLLYDPLPNYHEGEDNHTQGWCG